MSPLTHRERVFNGEPIDWSYWAKLKNITPHQAAKLANRIDPIQWPSNNCELGAIPEDTQKNIRKIEQQFGNQKATWSLQEIAEFLGDDAPEGMLEQVSIQNEGLTEQNVPIEIGRRDQQIAEILRVAKDLNYTDLMVIPEGGKSMIKNECLKNTSLFTKDSFKKAWQEANNRKLISMKDKHKYTQDKQTQTKRWLPVGKQLPPP